MDATNAVNGSTATVVANTGAVGSTGSTPVGSGSSPSGATSQGIGGAQFASTKPAKGFRLELQQLLAGVQQYLPSDSSVPQVAGASLSVSDIVQQLSATLSLYTAVDVQVTSLAQARAQLEGQIPSTRTFYQLVKVALTNFFGKGNVQLANFGFKPAKPKAKPTVDTLMAAKAKASATRALRGTQSKKQKAANQFKGNVVLSATPVSGPLPSPSASQPQSGAASAVTPTSPPGSKP